MTLLRILRSYTNFRAADVARFRDLSEADFTSVPLPTSCSSGEKIFRRIVVRASKRSVPAGRCTKFTPGLPREAADLAKQRDDLRAANPSDPSIAVINTEIKSLTSKSKRQRWREHVESCNCSSGPGQFWSLLRNMSGKRVFVPPNQPISFGSKFFSSPRSIANGFVKQYAPPPKSCKETRRVLRSIYRNHPLDHNFRPFTASDTVEAIRSSKNSTATGPDGLTPWARARGRPFSSYVTA